MKKLLLALISMGGLNLAADVVSLTPYYGQISYDSSYAKSYKDTAKLGGIHASVGDLSYLVEADYSHLQTRYKRYSPPLKDLKQDDATLVYGHYGVSSMFRIGGHYIATNDVQLGDGVVAIATLGAYRWFGYSKVSYGTHLYDSYYKKAHDENYVSKSVNIVQLSPYISYYKPFSYVSSNTLSVIVDYQYAKEYIKQHYASLQVSDTLYYKGWSVTLSGYYGETRTLVRDGGITVFNTLDAMKYGANVKLGYTMGKNFTANLSYGQNTYTEYGLTQEGTNQVALASCVLSF